MALVLYRDPSSREDWIEVLRELLASPDQEAKVTPEVSEVLGNVNLPMIRESPEGVLGLAADQRAGVADWQACRSPSED